MSLAYAVMLAVVGSGLVLAARDLADWHFKIQKYSVIRFEKKESWVSFHRICGFSMIVSSIVVAFVFR